MTVGDLKSAASAIIASIALVVSVISMRKANKSNETADQLNRLLIEREKSEGMSSKQADLSANIIQVGKSSHRLKIFNRGKGVANNVRLIDMDPDNTLLIDGDIPRKFPLLVLEQHQSVELTAVITKDTGSRAHIKLLWDDETGKNHEKELTPTV